MAAVLRGWLLLGFASLCLPWFEPHVAGQGTMTVLQTGGGQPLVTSQQALDLNGLPAPSVAFEFGFATQEVPTPGVFLDSFTVSLQDAASHTAVLVTADASGVLWAPPSSGAVTLTDSQIQRVAVAPPTGAPVLGNGLAFSVEMALPPSFTGSTVDVTFDLFDNQNAQSSLGWYQDVRVVSVPEPGAGLLGGLGLLLFVGVRRRP